MADKRLTIRLTHGWHDPGEGHIEAKTLDQAARKLITQNTEDKHAQYLAALSQQLSTNKNKTIAHMESLFRRRSGGFRPINEFTGAMAELSPKHTCEINLFTYAFLMHAKNYDFFTQTTEDNRNSMQKKINSWNKEVQLLEDYERLGKTSDEQGNKIDNQTTEQYKQLRTIIARPTARDELLTLVCLLVCGPSTKEDISLDLDLNYSLNQRIIAALLDTGTITTVAGSEPLLYKIEEKALAIVLFLVRETLGLNLLEMLANLGGHR